MAVTGHLPDQRFAMSGNLIKSGIGKATEDMDDNDLKGENSIRHEKSAFWIPAHCSGPRAPRCASSCPQRGQLTQSSFANFARLSQKPAQQRTQSATIEETEESPQKRSAATLAAIPADAPGDKALELH